MGEEWEQTLRKMGEASSISNLLQRCGKSLIYKVFPLKTSPKRQSIFRLQKRKFR
jgi:hypothetical protein